MATIEANLDYSNIPKPPDGMWQVLSIELCDWFTRIRIIDKEGLVKFTDLRTDDFNKYIQGETVIHAQCFSRSCVIDGVITTKFETTVKMMLNYDDGLAAGKLQIHHLASKDQVRI